MQTRQEWGIQQLVNANYGRPVLQDQTSHTVLIRKYNKTTATVDVHGAVLLHPENGTPYVPRFLACDVCYGTGNKYENNCSLYDSKCEHCSGHCGLWDLAPYPEPEELPRELMVAFDQYAYTTQETVAYPAEVGIVYTALGLVGEAGELANKLKKAIRDDDSSLTEDKRIELKNELGDVLWYLARLSQELGYELSEIATDNIYKLRTRKRKDKIKGSGDNR